MDNEGNYEFVNLPFGYKGSVPLTEGLFLNSGSGVVSMRFQFSISQGASTLVSLGSPDTFTIKVQNGLCTIAGFDPTRPLQFLASEQKSSQADVERPLPQLYDFVVVSGGESELTVYVNGRLLGKLEGALGVTGVLNKALDASSSPSSILYLFTAWSRALESVEVSMLYSLRYPTGGEEDYLANMRNALVCEFLPVNLFSVEGSSVVTWWNTVAIPPSMEEGDLVALNISNLVPGLVDDAPFICSEGPWEAAGIQKGGTDWVKVQFYNYSFFGSQICYVGLVGFSAAPNGLDALNLPLTFTTRPIWSSPDSNSDPGSMSPVTSTSWLVVEESNGKTWGPPSGVGLQVILDKGSEKLVPAGGVKGVSIEDYVKLDFGKLEQSYTTATGAIHTGSFTKSDISNVSYLFTYYDSLGESIARPIITVDSRGAIEGPVQVVGEVVATYYVHGVPGKTAPVLLRQEANELTEDVKITTLSLSTQSVGAAGGTVYYKSRYGSHRSWTSGSQEDVLYPCGVKTSEAWVALSTASSAGWDGALSVASFYHDDVRAADVSVDAPDSSYPARSLTITQSGAEGVQVDVCLQTIDDTFKDFTSTDRYIWFTGSISWGGVEFKFGGADGTPLPVRIKDLDQETIYSVGTIFLPKSEIWSNITSTLQCGAGVDEGGAGNPADIHADGRYCEMSVRPHGFNKDASTVVTYGTGAKVLSSAPFGYYPQGVGSTVTFTGGGNSMPVHASGGLVVFELSRLTLYTLQS